MGTQIDRDIYIHHLMAGRESGSSFTVKNGMLALCQNGWAKWNCDDKESLISAGDLCIIRPSCTVTLLDSSLDFELLAIHIMGKPQFTSIFKKLFPERYHKDMAHLFLIKPRPEYKPLVGNVLALLEGVVQDESIPTRMEMLKDVFTLISQMMHKYSLFENEWGTTSVKTWKDHLFEAFTAELARNYTQNRRVDFYAQLLHITPNYLFKVCQMVANKSPQKIINQHIIEQAQYLLKHHHELSIKEIAQQMGFPSQAYFGNFFFREVGMRPSEYRER